jgi:hypothetical protein
VSESADEQAGEGEVTPEAAEETLNAMFDAIRQAKVSDLVLSTASTLTSVAYGKLELKELDQAKLAIDAVDALLPLLAGQVEDEVLRDFTQAVTNLKLAYAAAVGPAQ